MHFQLFYNTSTVLLSCLQLVFMPHFFIQIFLHACSGKHYFVYCINLIHNRIDILDSIDYIWGNTDPEVRHRPIAEKMPIISAAFQKVTNNKFSHFGNWDRAFIDLPKQAGPNDCMFFLWKYREFWDGDRLNIDINPVSYYFTFFIFSICACDFSNSYSPFFPHVLCCLYLFSCISRG